jgi:hypothetical protein
MTLNAGLIVASQTIIAECKSSNEAQSLQLLPLELSTMWVRTWDEWTLVQKVKVVAQLLLLEFVDVHLRISQLRIHSLTSAVS